MDPFHAAAHILFDELYKHLEILNEEQQIAEQKRIEEESKKYKWTIQEVIEFELKIRKLAKAGQPIPYDLYDENPEKVTNILKSLDCLYLCPLPKHKRGPSLEKIDTIPYTEVISRAESINQSTLQTKKTGADYLALILIVLFFLIFIYAIFSLLIL